MGSGVASGGLFDGGKKLICQREKKKTNEGVGYTSRGVYIILDRSYVSLYLYKQRWWSCFVFDVGVARPLYG